MGVTAQKMKFSIKDFSRKCDQIRRKLRIWSHLLEKSLIENFIFCAMREMLLQINADVGKTIYEVNQNEIFDCDISTEKQLS